MKKNGNERILEQTEAFTQYSVPRALAKFMIPTVLSQLTFLVLNLADAFFVGRTGDTYQISSMAITFPVVMLISCVGTIFGAGANANMASELGRGNRKRAKMFSSFSIYTAAVTVMILSLILLFKKDAILYSIGADDHSLVFCREYLLWTFHVGCVPLVLSQVFSALFASEGESKIAAAGVGLAGVLNVLLDPIFIFPLKMGVAGAGLATCIANYISLIFYMAMFYRLRKTTIVSFDPRDYHVRDGICAKVLAVGVPTGLVLLFMDICDFTRNYYFNFLGGQVELAAWGVVQKIGNAFMQICVGIGQGIRPVVAYNFSAGSHRRVKKLINGAIVVMTIWVLFCQILVAVWPTQLVHLLIPSGEAVGVAVSYLRVWIFCVIGFGFIELFNAAFQSIGEWRISMANTFINKGLLLTPVMVFLANRSGISGILISQPITENVTAVILLIVYIHIMKQQAEH